MRKDPGDRQGAQMTQSTPSQLLRSLHRYGDYSCLRKGNPRHMASTQSSGPIASLINVFLGGDHEQR